MSIPQSTPQPHGGAFTPISVTGNTDPVTGECTVDFQASLPNQSEPDLVLSFYEAQQSASSTVIFIPITVDSPPTPVWNNGVASFSLVMNQDIFDQLSSQQTNFAVEVTANTGHNMGMCIFAIDLT